MAPLAKTPYALYKPLPNNLFLVRRTTDGEIFVAHPFDPDSTTSHDHAKTTELLRCGAGRAAANVLNHENIVSIHDELVDLPLSSDSAAQQQPVPRRMFLWDWCDAGILQNVFDTYSFEENATETGYLPEGFVWHVGLGVLRALQWLHEGERQGYGQWDVTGEEGKPQCGGERDWMPVLHRDVRAEKVFLQHPRGIETYGAVKLGGFEKCFVSGSVAATVETPVVVTERGDAPLGVLRERAARFQRDGSSDDEAHRPYTPGSDLFALGLTLHRMMTGRMLTNTPDCGCDDTIEDASCCHTYIGHVKFDRVYKRLTDYTDKLKDLVALLLALRSDMPWKSRSWNPRTSEVFTKAWMGFSTWIKTTEDGRLHRDIFDDVAFREQNERRLRKQDMDGGEAIEIDG